MFICISANPAIDKRLILSELVPGRIHRARSAQAHPGGKSTHVAMVLRALGEVPHWVGPCGGATGAELVAGLAALGVRAHPVPVTQPTRTNLEILDDRGTVTEILEPGAVPSHAELATFESSCKDLFAKGGPQANVIFSGSLPSGVASDLFARFLALAQSSGCRTFLDTSGEPLRIALGAGPHFVKPNRQEASFLLGAEIHSTDAAGAAVRRLISLGARSAALSLGADGLLFCLAKDTPVLFAPALPLEPRTTVGCGDAALAGFAHAIASGASVQDTLRLAAACAAANCLADSPGAVRHLDIEKFQGRVMLQTLPAGP
jgi:1-phosphofructokinase family hexose kinase